MLFETTCSFQNEIKQCAEEEEQVTDDKNRGIEELELVALL